MEFLMQSIRGSSFLEEAGESMVPPPVPEQQLPDQGVVEQAPAMRDGLVAEQGAGELAPADGSADAQILAVADAANRKENHIFAGFKKFKVTAGVENTGSKLTVKMTSSQRSESANHMLKNHVPPGCPMHMFVHKYLRLQFDRESEENYEEKRMQIRRPLMRANLAVERHASKIYTRAMFEQFGHILYECEAYHVEEIETHKTYVAIHSEAEKSKWCRVSYKVLDFIWAKEIQAKHREEVDEGCSGHTAAHLAQYQKDRVTLGASIGCGAEFSEGGVGSEANVNQAASARSDGSVVSRMLNGSFQSSPVHGHALVATVYIDDKLHVDPEAAMEPEAGGVEGTGEHDPTAIVSAASARLSYLLTHGHDSEQWQQRNLAVEGCGRS
ncbi:hypothetical protein TRIUR3_08583 [Triticum urartu]|uniref:Uncharacterized protein n=1 Tax=Triticum urartu TaxID=4572 RepID=M7ZN90_TRIUA|nr:hypothetical protein TRIUR3_08583 [Triticum urartu]